MKKLFIPSLVALLIILTGCNSNFANSKDVNIISESREVAPFNGVISSHGISVKLSMGNEESVTITADSSIMKNIVTENKGGALKVYVKNKKFKFKNHKITVNIVAKDIKLLNASSGSFINSTDTIKTTNIEVTSSSGAGVSAIIKAINTSCDVSSGASASLSGITKEFVGDASSGSKLNAQDLRTVNANLDVSSGANISITVRGNLNANASSGGSINYKGSPTMKNIDKSSGGSVSGN